MPQAPVVAGWGDSPAQAGRTLGCSGTCPVELLKSWRMQISQPLWTICFHMSDRNFLFCNLWMLSLAHRKVFLSAAASCQLSDLPILLSPDILMILLSLSSVTIIFYLAAQQTWFPWVLLPQLPFTLVWYLPRFGSDFAGKGNRLHL